MTAYAVLPDSVKFDLADKNSIVAVFKIYSQAVDFASLYYQCHYIIEPIETDIFNEKSKEKCSR